MFSYRLLQFSNPTIEFHSDREKKYSEIKQRSISLIYLIAVNIFGSTHRHKIYPSNKDFLNKSPWNGLIQKY